MPRQSCPHCDRPLPYAAARCRHCGWARGIPARERLLRRGRVWTVSLVLLGVMAVGLAFRNATALADWYASFAARYLPATASSFGPADTEDGAFYFCARRVSKKMEGEFSVETFPDGSGASTVSLGEGRYEVRAYVDQDKEDGARVRYDFTCQVRYDSGHWVLERLTVQNLAAR